MKVNLGTLRYIINNNILTPMEKYRFLVLRIKDFEDELQEIILDYKNHGELRYSTIELVKEILGE